MNLDDAQKQQVAGWIEEGLKLSEIQKRLETDFGLRITYMEVRLLVDDLKLVPKDQPESHADEVLAKAKEAADATAAEGAAEPSASAPNQVSLQVDTLTRPGALISGSVTFSDGKAATWYLDQMGRLGVVPKEQGYKPSAADLQEFQTKLQNELQRSGLMG